jgi:hypothetical protein
VTSALQTGIGGFSANDVLKKDVTTPDATGDVTAANLVSKNSIYGGFNGFSVRPKNGSAGLLIFGDGSVRCDVIIGTASCKTAPTVAYHLTRKDYVALLSYLTA